MYRILYWFGKRIMEYIAWSEVDRDSFLNSLKRYKITVFMVKEVK